MLSSIVEVLDFPTVDGSSSEQKGEACGLLEALQSFDFALCLELQRNYHKPCKGKSKIL